MVEATANSVEDYLIDGLSFKLSPGASYVSERKSVSWFASGAQSYISGQGARVIRLQINGDGWLDLSTVRLIYTLRNNITTTKALLRPICGPWSFFRRARMLMGGAICDDIDSYGRNHEMLHILTSKANRDNDDVEGFGYRWDNDTFCTYAGFIGTDANNFGGIAGRAARTVLFKPLFGLF